MRVGASTESKRASGGTTERRDDGAKGRRSEGTTERRDDAHVGGLHARPGAPRPRSAVRASPLTPQERSGLRLRLRALPCGCGARSPVFLARRARPFLLSIFQSQRQRSQPARGNAQDLPAFCEDDHDGGSRVARPSDFSSR
eukprot:4050278-Prymnesium_polylepis.2